MTEKQAKEFYKHKAPKVNVDINQYWVVETEDYHEFGWNEINYKKAGLDVEYEEVGWNREYVAVFWVGERPTEYIEKYKEINFFE